MPLGRRSPKVAAAAAGSALIAGAFAAVGPADAEKPRAKARVATALLRDAGGDALGRVDFRPVRRTVEVRYTLTGLTRGFHGFDVHTTGRCDPDTTDPTTGRGAPFLSAQGHLTRATLRTAPTPATCRRSSRCAMGGRVAASRRTRCGCATSSTLTAAR